MCSRFHRRQWSSLSTSERASYAGWVIYGCTTTAFRYIDVFLIRCRWYHAQILRWRVEVGVLCYQSCHANIRHNRIEGRHRKSPQFSLGTVRTLQLYWEFCHIRYKGNNVIKSSLVASNVCILRLNTHTYNVNRTEKLLVIVSYSRIQDLLLTIYKWCHMLILLICAPVPKVSSQFYAHCHCVCWINGIQITTYSPELMECWL